MTLWPPARAQGCVDTTAAVGTVFPVLFSVVNSRGISANITRLVAIASACPGNLYYCGATIGCSAVECDLLNALPSFGDSNSTAPPSPPPGPPPTLRLLAPSPLLIPYGQITGAGLAPCASADGAWPTCGATATDSNGADISASIVFSQARLLPCQSATITYYTEYINHVCVCVSLRLARS